MSESKINKAPPLQENGQTLSLCQVALAATFKALKAFSFYPEGHPLRERILQGAYQTVVRATQDAPLELIVHRNGFSHAVQRTAVDPTPMITALAQELFAREIQRFTVLPDLPQTEYLQFLSLLALEPARILAAGGLAAMVKQHGIERIALNEIDITAVFTRKKEEQASDTASGQDTGSEEGESSATRLPEETNQLTPEELLGLMARESDDDRFRQLARMLFAKAVPLKQEGEFDRLYVLDSALLGMVEDQGRSQSQRDQARLVVQQLVAGEPAEHLLDHLEQADFRHAEAVYRMFALAGAEVVDAVVARLVAAGIKASRKPLSAALLHIGPAAEPALFQLLKDPRWQVVLTSVAILAEMGSKEAVQELEQAAYHSDGRVRMESIRALAMIGGPEASAALVELLKDPNHAIAVHAATWIGNTRNHRGLQPLLQLVHKRDLLGRIQGVRKEALLAIGRIGDKRALEPLCRLVAKRYWIAPGRWEELQIAAVEAIGNLGGSAARQFLAQAQERGGRLGRACAKALDGMAKRNPEHHE